MPVDDGTISEARDRVRTDVTEGLADWFSGPSDFAVDINGLDNDDTVTASKTFVTVPWVFRARHTGYFLGIPPTFLDVELRGATFVEVTDESDPDAWRYHRYIDYLGVLHQLGVTTTTRPVLTPDQYADYLERRRP